MARARAAVSEVLEWRMLCLREVDQTPMRDSPARWMMASRPERSMDWWGCHGRISAKGASGRGFLEKPTMEWLAAMAAAAR